MSARLVICALATALLLSATRDGLDTLAAFTASDTASGVLRAGVWSKAGPPPHCDERGEHGQPGPPGQRDDADQPGADPRLEMPGDLQLMRDTAIATTREQPRSEPPHNTSSENDGGTANGAQGNHGKGGNNGKTPDCPRPRRATPEAPYSGVAPPTAGATSEAQPSSPRGTATPAATPAGWFNSATSAR